MTPPRLRSFYGVPAGLRSDQTTTWRPDGHRSGNGHFHGDQGGSGKTTISADFLADSCPKGAGVQFGQAATMYLEEAVDLTDLDDYVAKWAPAGVGRISPPAAHGCPGCSGASNAVQPPRSSLPGSYEAMMDVELLAALAPGVATVVWGTAGRSPDPVTTQDDGDHNEPFVAFALQVAKSRCPPAVYSISYTDEEDSATRRYATRFATEMAKAGARGISVLVASGDNGSGGAWRENCHGKFQPSFPSAVPWITAVGGTSAVNRAQGRRLDTDEQGRDFTRAVYNEVAHPQSSGGFSVLFKRPPYQRRAVAAYLRPEDPATATSSGASSALPSKSTYHGAGRGYPDVAAMYHTYAIACGGRDVTISGTSASTPVVAGFVSLLNDIRRAAGKPPLGFLNPLLYKHPEALHDILSGKNEGCNGMGGFPAREGWDAVTGLGSPNFAKLTEIVRNLP